MGAVPHICNGANVMAPGIRRFKGDFVEGDLVSIVDENHEKPLAIGEILYNAKTANIIKHGLVVRNIHYVGDKIWSIMKKF